MLESFAESITKYLASAVEILAAIVIGIGVVQFLFRYARYLVAKQKRESTSAIRVRFGSTLTLALELLLGADILATAIAPTWDDIGKLAAIAVLRTALNYFLERELKNSGIEKNKQLDV